MKINEKILSNEIDTAKKKGADFLVWQELTSIQRDCFVYGYRFGQPGDTSALLSMQSNCISCRILFDDLHHILSILVLGWLKLSKFPWNKITLEGVFQMGIIPLLCYKFFLNSFVLRFIIQRRFPFFRRFYISFLLHVFSLRVQYAKKIISDQKNTTMIGKIPNHIWMMNLRV